MPDPDPQLQAYRRGVIDQKLHEYGEHLQAINGSTERTALALQELNRTQVELLTQIAAVVRRLDTEAETRVALAKALREAEEVRRAQTDRKWAVPLGRLALLVGVVGGIVGLWLAFRPSA